MKRSIKVAALLLAAAVFAQAKTDVILLGTGTPVPDAKRAGSGVAVVYDGEAYLFDIGGGVVKNAMKAAQEMGIKELYPTKIKHLFITHLHSDHVTDYAELAATYWWRRDVQMSAYGPVGLKEMNDGYNKLLEIDVHARVHDVQPVKEPTFYQVKINEYEKGGWIFKDKELTIEAFEVIHGNFKPSFGYKIVTPDKSIVISGDTVYSEKVAEMSKGVDVLIHEVINEDGLSKQPESWQKYHKHYHTTTSDLAKLATEAKPKVLVLTHVLHYAAPIESTLTEVKQKYGGNVVLGNDLDKF